MGGARAAGGQKLQKQESATIRIGAIYVAGARLIFVFRSHSVLRSSFAWVQYHVEPAANIREKGLSKRTPLCFQCRCEQVSSLRMRGQLSAPELNQQSRPRKR